MANQNELYKSDSTATQPPRGESFRARPAVAPRVDVYENQDEVLLLADLPGVEADGLHLSFEAGQLTLEGRRKESAHPAIAGDGRAADYRRTFVLPEGIASARIAAELKEGVLWVHLPKAEPHRPRRIEVKS